MENAGVGCPEVKTFIDTRVDILKYAGVLQDYLDLLGSDSLLRRIDCDPGSQSKPSYVIETLGWVMGIESHSQRK